MVLYNEYFQSIAQVSKLGYPDTSDIKIPLEYLENGQFVLFRTCHSYGDWVLLSAIPRLLKQKYPNLPVLVLTSHSQKSLITRLIEVGAQGYCLKGVAAEKLVLALYSVASGASWWDETATREIRSVFVPDSDSVALANNHQVDAENSSKPANKLTQREQEILLLLAAGKTNQEIALALYITPGTVRVHVHTILQKLEVSDRSQAVVVALQKRLIKNDLI